MKKIMLFIFLLCSTFISLGQNNYIQYFQAKANAELSICKYNYSDALNYYKKAFVLVDYPLVKELYNATICAAIIEQDSLMFNYLEKCLKRGVSINCFKKNELVFFKYFTYKKWKELENSIDYFQKNNLANINKEYEIALKSIDEKDQYVRRFSRFSLIFSRKKIKRNLLRTDSINKIKIDSLIDLFGYPCEQILGVSGNNLSCSTPVSFFHMIDSCFVFNTQYKALMEGKITPEDYSRKVDYTKSRHKIDPIFYNVYYSKLPTDSIRLKNIDNNRIAIGLQTLENEDVMRRYFYDTKNKYLFFIIIPFRI